MARRAKRAEDPSLSDGDLEDLPPELRWREWMGRVEALIFASTHPVPREHLAALVGPQCKLDLLIEDIRAELAARPYELVAGAIRASGKSEHRAQQVSAQVGRKLLESAGDRLDLGVVQWIGALAKILDERLHLKCSFCGIIIQDLRDAGLEPPQKLIGVDSIIGRMRDADVVPNIEDMLELLVGRVGD
jgi:hypothetical protein